MSTSGIFELLPGTTLATGDVVPFVDISDSTQAPQGSLLKITIANFFATVPTPITVTAGTVTVSTPVFQATQTWNAGGVTFTGLSLSITDTASAAGSYLMMLRVGGSEKFSVNKAGVAQAVSQFKGIATGNGSASAFLAYTGAGYGWTDAGAGVDGKNWGMNASGTTLTLSAYSDTNGTASLFLSFTRSGNSAVSVDLSVQLNAPTAVVGSAGAASTFTIGNAAPAADATGSLKFLNSNTNLNWQVQATNGTLTVTPSTAGGGSTFTTPLLTFAATTVTLATGSTLAAKALTFTTSISSTTALATPSALSATQFTGFASTVSGAALMGYGTTNDVSLMNRAGTVCLGIGPNTTAVNIPGSLVLTGATVTGAPTWSSTQNMNISGNAAGTAGSVAASALTGMTLAANVVTSSLTTIGTLGSLTVSGTSALGVVTASGAATCTLANGFVSALSATGGDSGGYIMKTGGVTRWYMGVKGADETFAIYNAGGSAINFNLTDAGSAVFRSFVDAPSYKVGGVAGASGTFANVTVVNGIVTSGT